MYTLEIMRTVWMTEVNTRMGFAGPEDHSKRFRIHPDFMLREIAGEAVIIPLGETQFSNAMMVPNRSAVFLWKAFSEPSTEDDVVARALEQFEADEEAVRADVKRFIAESLNKNVLLEVD